MKLLFFRTFAIVSCVATQFLACGQPVARNSKQSPPLASPEVGKDGRISFRLRMPSAKKVYVYGDFGNKIAMESHEDGIWTATTEPTAPDLFTYYFNVDGTTVADSSNPLVSVSQVGPESLALVPGNPPEIWEERDVPHGVVREHWYKSRTLGLRRNFYIYTPPGYETGNATYPVLYLLHGSGDTAEAWTRAGRAHVIYDNLIADGKAVPAIIVMPDGHVERPKGRTNSPNTLTLFTKDLIDDVMPLVEHEYRVSKLARDRAIAGLSSGANQSAAIGLNHPEVFSQVGPFSGGGMYQDGMEERYAGFLANPAAAKNGLRLVWISIGKDDRSVEVIKNFSAFLDKYNVKHTVTFTPGAHTWPVWRRNLREFAPLLFRP